MSSDLRRNATNVVYVLLCVAAFGLLSRNFLEYLACDYVADDAYISLRYAQRLLAGDGLTWSDGERVEGYSNLLWVLATAALGSTGMSLLTAARILGVFGTGMAFLGLAWMVRPARMGDSAWPGAFAMFAFAQCQPLVIWTCAGLETPFVVGFLALGLVAVVTWLEARPPARYWLFGAGGALALLTLTRPDGPLFVAVLSGAVAVRSWGRGWRAALRDVGVTCGLPLVAFVGQEVFRVVYYGQWVPNTALVKLPTGLYRLQEGVEYLFDGLRHQWPIWVVALASIAPLLSAGSSRARRRIQLLWVVAAVWTSYVVYAGGDHLIGRRFLVPTLFLLCWLAAEGLAWSRQALAARRAIANVALLAFLVAFQAWFSVSQWQDGQVTAARWDHLQPRRRGEFFAWFFDQAFDRDRPLFIAVDSAGSVPFYLPEDRFLDMLGLTDPWLALHQRRESRTGRLAHTLGDAGYYLERRPDVFLFGPLFGSSSGLYASQRQLTSDPLFLDDYRFLELAWEGRPRVRLWVRRDVIVREEDPADRP